MTFKEHEDNICLKLKKFKSSASPTSGDDLYLAIYNLTYNLLSVNFPDVSMSSRKEVGHDVSTEIFERIVLNPQFVVHAWRVYLKLRSKDLMLKFLGTQREFSELSVDHEPLCSRIHNPEIYVGAKQHLDLIIKRIISDIAQDLKFSKYICYLLVLSIVYDLDLSSFPDKSFGYRLKFYREKICFEHLGGLENSLNICNS